MKKKIAEKKAYDNENGYRLSIKSCPVKIVYALCIKIDKTVKDSVKNEKENT